MYRLLSGEAPRGSLALLLFPLCLTIAPGCRGTSADDSRVDVGSSDQPRLTATFDSPEDLARTVVAAVAREDRETLQRLPLSKDEFRLYVWPRLPASNPEQGMPLEYAWGELSQKSRGALAQTFARYKGRALEYLAVEFEGETTDYGTYKVHRDARVQVRLDDGRQVWLDLFGSVMEWKGKYKLFSYVTD